MNSDEYINISVIPVLNVFKTLTVDKMNAHLMVTHLNGEIENLGLINQDNTHLTRGEAGEVISFVMNNKQYKVVT